MSECLTSLEKQNLHGVSLEIVVVDNASTDHSDALIEKNFSHVRLIHSDHNRGFGAAVNLGVQHSSGEIIVLLNNDATAEPNFIQAITAPFQAEGSQKLAAVTARILLSGRFVVAPAEQNTPYVSHDGRRWLRLPPDSPPEKGVVLLNSTGNQISRSGNGSDRSWLTPLEEDASPSEVFGFCGGAAAIRREAFTRLGGFDEQLFMYYEDTDLSWRLRRAGWDIRYTDEAVAYHRHAASSDVTSAFFLTHNIRNRLVVTAKNGPNRMLMVALFRTLGTMARGTFTHNFWRRQKMKTLRWATCSVPNMLRKRISGNSHELLPRNFVSQWAIKD